MNSVQIQHDTAPNATPKLRPAIMILWVCDIKCLSERVLGKFAHTFHANMHSYVLIWTPKSATIATERNQWYDITVV